MHDAPLSVIYEILELPLSYRLYIVQKNNEWSSHRCNLPIRDCKKKSNWFKLSSHGPPCHLFNIMADVTSVSDSENFIKSTEAKTQAESVQDGAESEAEEGASEFEIEEVLDAKRGYFPEVCTAIWY